MARPRQYASDAERQRAFRRRQARETVRVDRPALERLHALLHRLQMAIYAAATAGDATARACSAAHWETLLEQLAHHFEQRAEPRPERERR
jgi:hypothetical protein